MVIEIQDPKKNDDPTIKPAEEKKEGFRTNPPVFSEDSESSSDDSSSSISFLGTFSKINGNYTPTPIIPAKTRGELDLEDLPPIEDLNISVSERDLRRIGHVSAIVGKQVVVQSLLIHEPAKPLNFDTVLFLTPYASLGKIFDVLGPVVEPQYTVRFNEEDDIKMKGVKSGADVFYCPEREDLTSYVFVDELRNQKGSDASWKHNNEPPEECLDYSDDEQERVAKQKRRAKSRLSDGAQTPPKGISPTKKMDLRSKPNCFARTTTKGNGNFPRSDTRHENGLNISSELSSKLRSAGIGTSQSSQPPGRRPDYKSVRPTFQREPQHSPNPWRSPSFICHSRFPSPSLSTPPLGYPYPPPSHFQHNGMRPSPAISPFNSPAMSPFNSQGNSPSQVVTGMPPPVLSPFPHPFSLPPPMLPAPSFGAMPNVTFGTPPNLAFGAASNFPGFGSVANLPPFGGASNFPSFESLPNLHSFESASNLPPFGAVPSPSLPAPWVNPNPQMFGQMNLIASTVAQPQHFFTSAPNTVWATQNGNMRSSCFQPINVHVAPPHHMNAMHVPQAFPNMIPFQHNVYEGNSGFQNGYQ